jgi:hypothetical protein
MYVGKVEIELQNVLRFHPSRAYLVSFPPCCNLYFIKLLDLLNIRVWNEWAQTCHSWECDTWIPSRVPHKGDGSKRCACLEVIWRSTQIWLTIYLLRSFIECGIGVYLMSAFKFGAFKNTSSPPCEIMYFVAHVQGCVLGGMVKLSSSWQCKCCEQLKVILWMGDVDF